MKKNIIFNKCLRKWKNRLIFKGIWLIFSLFFIATTISMFSIGTRRSYFTKNQNHARWIENNGLKYLYLEAVNEFELGKLEGKFLSAQITNLKRILQVFGILNCKYGFSYSDMISKAQKYESFIPLEFIQEMQGISQVILGISYEDVLLQNCFIDLLYGQYFPNATISSPNHENIEIGCTVVGYKTNESVLVGQNFDFNNIFKHTLVFVHHRVQGKRAQFGLKVGGILSLPCGTNSMGNSVFINVVKTFVKASYYTPIAFRTRIAFDSADNIEEFLTYITSQPSTLSMNLMLANKSDIISLELIPGNITIKQPNQAVNTNTYTNEFWQQYLQDKQYSKLRQNVTEELLMNLTLDEVLSQSDFIEIMSNPLVVQSESGIMGVSTLVCLSSCFFYKGIASFSNNCSPNPI
ncbi:MAG: hypothetical protein JW776_10015 [Candidatus Lokiarchaeota archaeon]|nr:hypothetical protein [Candidatus Lokiarchaeota archaeon]